MTDSKKSTSRIGTDWGGVENSASIDPNYFNRCQFLLKMREDRSSSIRGNHENHMYHELQNAIASMARLPTEHHLHLNKSIAEKAMNLLGILHSNTFAGHPKLLNESGEALSFTWEHTNHKRYLTIDEDSVEITDYASTDSLPSSIDLGTIDDVNVGDLLKSLAVKARSETSQRV